MVLRIFLMVFLLAFSPFLTGSLSAQEPDNSILVAEGPRLSKAVGHFSRARQLLISALREFDKGSKVASPEVLIDIEAWRNSVSDRANDLQVIIAPQPRVTNDGVTFDAEIKIFDNIKDKQ